MLGHGGEAPVRRQAVVPRSKCGKFLYTKKKLAKASAALQSRDTGEDIRAYHCYGCHGYHIGHPPKPYVPRAA